MTQPRNHRCYAAGCTRTVPAQLLMCARHWRLVPKAIQKRVWAAYQNGQEQPAGPAPTGEYWAAVKAAVEAVIAAEGKAAAGLFD